MPQSIIDRKLKIVNIGLSTFTEDLKKQGVDAIQVDWSPPAGGDEEMLRLLEKLGH